MMMQIEQSNPNHELETESIDSKKYDERPSEEERQRDEDNGSNVHH